MSMSWRCGKPYDVIRANREAELMAGLMRIRDYESAVELTRYPGYYVTPRGDVYATSGRRLTKLKPGTKPGGYKFVGLTNANAERKYEMVHRLVANAFVPNPCALPEVNHIDGDKANNHVRNLEWCTRSGNARHAVAHGLMPVGPGIKSALTESDISIIRDAVGRYRDIGARFGISAQTVCNIKRGSTQGRAA